MLGVVTVSGYAIAFAYEAGFAKARGIPLEFVDAKLPTIFLAIGGLALSLSWLYHLFNGLTVFSRASNHPLVRYLSGQNRLLFVTLAFALVLGRQLWWITAILASYIVISTIVMLIVPLRTQRHVKGYLAKLAAADAAEIKATDKTIALRLAKTVGASGYVLAYTLLTLILLSGAYGASSALSRHTFWVVPGKPEYVVLRIYGDRAVIAELDRAGHAIKPNYKVIALPAETTFKSELLGPLKSPPLTLITR